MTNKDETQVLVDASFDDAMTMMRDYATRHKEIGPLAIVSLARALGLLTIGSSPDARGMAISTVINQMTSIMCDAMEYQHEEDAA